MAEAKIDQKTVAALVGRSLSKTESDNFDLYLNIAVTRVSDLICDDLTKMEEIPDDLKLVVARFFDALTKEQKLEADVESKKVEDFSITYREGYLPAEEVMNLCRATLAKYSKCNAADGIIHGGTIYGHHRI